MLKSFYNFVKIYINNIIAFSRILTKYFEYLRKFFILFRERRVNFNFNKSFLEYSFVILFN